MFNKYFINDNQSAITAAHITARSNEKLGEKLESISKAQIKSKDRVDISLEEYTKMRERIQTLEGKYSRMSKLITRLGIPVEVIDAIIPDSVDVLYSYRPMEFKRQYRIKFDVEDSPMTRHLF